MTNQALPGRPPAHDLSAFDLSKRSPEQVARSFARWKAQRKRQAEAGPARADPLPSPQASGTGDAAPGESTPAETKRASAKQASTPQYSAPFSDLLAAGSEPTVQRTEWPPVAAVRPPQRTASPGRRLKVMSILAGAASVFALAGGALLELADWRDPAEVAPQMAHVRPKETPMALAAPATSAPTAGWTLQHTVDVALMKAAPAAVRPTPEPPTPAIQTASKTVPVAGGKPAILPERKSVAPEAAQFVAKPYVPTVAPTPAWSPAAQAAAPVPASPVAAAVHAGDPRPDDLFQHGRDSRNGAVTNRTASSGKPAAATGTGSAIDARPASARKSPAASSGSADPRGEGSGGARVGVAGEVGAGAASDVSGVGGGGDTDTGTGDASDVSGDGGANGGGSSAGPADGGDTAGDGAGGAGTGDAGTGANDAGGGETGGEESGDASDSGSEDTDAGEDSESGGIGGAIGGALGAVGDALGGGKGNPDSNDKDQRN